MSTQRALIVGPVDTDASAELVQSLVSSHDLVVAVDAGAEVCRQASVACDVVVGDMDSISPAELERLERTGVRLDRHPADKDVTDLDLALEEVLRLGCSEATVTGVLGERIDHSIAVIGSLARCAALQLTIAEPGLSGWVVRVGESVFLEGRGSTLSVFAVLTEAVVSVAGVRWELDRACLTPLSSRGLSNVIVAPQALVSVESGIVAVLSAEVGGTKPAACVRRNKL